ncbi:hypothetical protein TNCV_2299401 [Trichonephila clavipes]|nr:hypothetical protein TNCV_2299401 [Trichonephila clavipes]
MNYCKIGLSTMIPLINQTKDSLFPEFLWLRRDPVLHSILEFIVRVEVLSFHRCFSGNQMPGNGRATFQAVGRMVKLLPLELCQCDARDVWKCVILEQNHTFRSDE